MRLARGYAFDATIRCSHKKAASIIDPQYLPFCSNRGLAVFDANIKPI